MKLQLKDFESNINTINGRINSITTLELSQNQNEEKINLLNNEITLLKEKLDETSIKKDEDIKLKNDANKSKNKGDYNTSYILIFLFICIVVVCCIYRVYFGREGGDSRKLRHMNISSHSGYGSISSTNF